MASEDGRQIRIGLDQRPEGMVERVTARDHLDEAVQSWVGHTLTSAPGSRASAKIPDPILKDLPLRAAIAARIDAFAAAYETDEPRSKMRQFLDAQAARRARE